MSCVIYRHEGPFDELIRISEEEFDRRAKQNVERWVSAHIVPVSTICHISSAEVLTYLSPEIPHHPRISPSHAPSVEINFIHTHR